MEVESGHHDRPRMSSIERGESFEIERHPQVKRSKLMKGKSRESDNVMDAFFSGFQSTLLPIGNEAEEMNDDVCALASNGLNFLQNDPFEQQAPKTEGEESRLDPSAGRFHGTEDLASILGPNNVACVSVASSSGQSSLAHGAITVQSTPTGNDSTPQDRIAVSTDSATAGLESTDYRSGHVSGIEQSVALSTRSSSAQDGGMLVDSHQHSDWGEYSDFTPSSSGSLYANSVVSSSSGSGLANSDCVADSKLCKLATIERGESFEVADLSTITPRLSHIHAGFRVSLNDYNEDSVQSQNAYRKDSVGNYSNDVTRREMRSTVWEECEESGSTTSHVERGACSSDQTMVYFAADVSPSRVDTRQSSEIAAEDGLKNDDSKLGPDSSAVEGERLTGTDERWEISQPGSSTEVSDRTSTVTSKRLSSAPSVERGESFESTSPKTVRGQGRLGFIVGASGFHTSFHSLVSEDKDEVSEEVIENFENSNHVSTANIDSKTSTRLEESASTNTDAGLSEKSISAYRTEKIVPQDSDISEDHNQSCEENAFASSEGDYTDQSRPQFSHSAENHCRNASQEDITAHVKSDSFEYVHADMLMSKSVLTFHSGETLIEQNCVEEASSEKPTDDLQTMQFSKAAGTEQVRDISQNVMENNMIPDPTTPSSKGQDEWRRAVSVLTFDSQTGDSTQPCSADGDSSSSDGSSKRLPSRPSIDRGESFDISSPPKIKRRSSQGIFTGAGGFQTSFPIGLDEEQADSAGKHTEKSSDELWDQEPSVGESSGKPKNFVSFASFNFSNQQSQPWRNQSLDDVSAKTTAAHDALLSGKRYFSGLRSDFEHSGSVDTAYSTYYSEISLPAKSCFNPFLDTPHSGSQKGAPDNVSITDRFGSEGLRQDMRTTNPFNRDVSEKTGSQSERVLTERTFHLARSDTNPFHDNTPSDAGLEGPNEIAEKDSRSTDTSADVKQAESVQLRRSLFRSRGPTYKTVETSSDRSSAFTSVTSASSQNLVSSSSVGEHEDTVFSPGNPFHVSSSADSSMVTAGQSSSYISYGFPGDQSPKDGAIFQFDHLRRPVDPGPARDDAWKCKPQTWDDTRTLDSTEHLSATLGRLSSVSSSNFSQSVSLDTFEDAFVSTATDSSTENALQTLHDELATATRGLYTQHLPRENNFENVQTVCPLMSRSLSRQLSGEEQNADDSDNDSYEIESESHITCEIEPPEQALSYEEANERLSFSPSALTRQEMNATTWNRAYLTRHQSWGSSDQTADVDDHRHSVKYEESVESALQQQTEPAADVAENFTGQQFRRKKKVSENKPSDSLACEGNANSEPDAEISSDDSENQGQYVLETGVIERIAVAPQDDADLHQQEANTRNIVQSMINTVLVDKAANVHGELSHTESEDHSSAVRASHTLDRSLSTDQVPVDGRCHRQYHKNEVPDQGTIGHEVSTEFDMKSLLASGMKGDMGSATFDINQRPSSAVAQRPSDLKGDDRRHLDLSQPPAPKPSPADEEEEEALQIMQTLSELTKLWDSEHAEDTASDVASSPGYVQSGSGSRPLKMSYTSKVVSFSRENSTTDQDVLYDDEVIDDVYEEDEINGVLHQSANVSGDNIAAGFLHDSSRVITNQQNDTSTTEKSEICHHTPDNDLKTTETNLDTLQETCAPIQDTSLERDSRPGGDSTGIYFTADQVLVEQPVASRKGEHVELSNDTQNITVSSNEDDTGPDQSLGELLPMFHIERGESFEQPTRKILSKRQDFGLHSLGSFQTSFTACVIEENDTNLPADQISPSWTQSAEEITTNFFDGKMFTGISNRNDSPSQEIPHEHLNLSGKDKATSDHEAFAENDNQQLEQPGIVSLTSTDNDSTKRSFDDQQGQIHREQPDKDTNLQISQEELERKDNQLTLASPSVDMPSDHDSQIWSASTSAFPVSEDKVPLHLTEDMIVYPSRELGNASDDLHPLLFTPSFERKEDHQVMKDDSKDDRIGDSVSPTSGQDTEPGQQKEKHFCSQVALSLNMASLGKDHYEQENDGQAVAESCEEITSPGSTVVPPNSLEESEVHTDYERSTDLENHECDEDVFTASTDALKDSSSEEGRARSSSSSSDSSPGSQSKPSFPDQPWTAYQRLEDEPGDEVANVSENDAVFTHTSSAVVEEGYEGFVPSTEDRGRCRSLHRSGGYDRQDSNSEIDEESHVRAYRRHGHGQGKHKAAKTLPLVADSLRAYEADEDTCSEHATPVTEIYPPLPNRLSQDSDLSLGQDDLGTSDQPAVETFLQQSSDSKEIVTVQAVNESNIFHQINQASESYVDTGLQDQQDLLTQSPRGLSSEQDAFGAQKNEDRPLPKDRLSDTEMRNEKSNESPSNNETRQSAVEFEEKQLQPEQDAVIQNVAQYMVSSVLESAGKHVRECSLKETDPLLNSEQQDNGKQRDISHSVQEDADNKALFAEDTMAVLRNTPIELQSNVTDGEVLLRDAQVQDSSKIELNEAESDSDTGLTDNLYRSSTTGMSSVDDNTAALDNIDIEDLSIFTEIEASQWSDDQAAQSDRDGARSVDPRVGGKWKEHSLRLLTPTLLASNDDSLSSDPVSPASPSDRMPYLQRQPGFIAKNDFDHADEDQSIVLSHVDCSGRTSGHFNRLHGQSSEDGGVNLGYSFSRSIDSLTLVNFEAQAAAEIERAEQMGYNSSIDEPDSQPSRSGSVLPSQQTSSEEILSPVEPSREDLYSVSSFDIVLSPKATSDEVPAAGVFAGSSFDASLTIPASANDNVLSKEVSHGQACGTSQEQESGTVQFKNEDDRPKSPSWIDKAVTTARRAYSSLEERMKRKAKKKREKHQDEEHHQSEDDDEMNSDGDWPDSEEHGDISSENDGPGEPPAEITELAGRGLADTETIPAPDLEMVNAVETDATDGSQHQIQPQADPDVSLDATILPHSSDQAVKESWQKDTELKNDYDETSGREEHSASLEKGAENLATPIKDLLGPCDNVLEETDTVEQEGLDEDIARRSSRRENVSIEMLERFLSVESQHSDSEMHLDGTAQSALLSSVDFHVPETELEGSAASFPEDTVDENVNTDWSQPISESTKQLPQNEPQPHSRYGSNESAECRLPAETEFTLQRPQTTEFTWDVGSTVLSEEQRVESASMQPSFATPGSVPFGEYAENLEKHAGEADPALNSFSLETTSSSETCLSQPPDLLLERLPMTDGGEVEADPSCPEDNTQKKPEDVLYVNDSDMSQQDEISGKPYVEVSKSHIDSQYLAESTSKEVPENIVPGEVEHQDDNARHSSETSHSVKTLQISDPGTYETSSSLSAAWQEQIFENSEKHSFTKDISGISLTQSDTVTKQKYLAEEEEKSESEDGFSVSSMDNEGQSVEFSVRNLDTEHEQSTVQRNTDSSVKILDSDSSVRGQDAEHDEQSTVQRTTDSSVRILDSEVSLRNFDSEHGENQTVQLNTDNSVKSLDFEHDETSSIQLNNDSSVRSLDIEHDEPSTVQLNPDSFLRSLSSEHDEPSTVQLNNDGSVRTLASEISAKILDVERGEHQIIQLNIDNSVRNLDSENLKQSTVQLITDSSLCEQEVVSNRMCTTDPNVLDSVDKVQSMGDESYSTQRATLESESERKISSTDIFVKTVVDPVHSTQTESGTDTCAVLTEAENQSLEEEAGRQSPSWKEKVMTTAKNIYGSLERRMKRKKKKKKDTGDVSGENVEGDIEEEDDESYESGSNSDEDIEEHCDKDDNIVKTGDKDLDLNKTSDNIYSPISGSEMRLQDESPQTNSAKDLSQLSSEYKQREVKGIAAEVTVQTQGSSVLHSDISSSVMFAKGVEAPEVNMDPTATFHQESDITGDWTEDQSTNTLSLMETDLSDQKTVKLVSKGSLDQDDLTSSTQNVDEKEHSVCGEGIDAVAISNQSDLISELIQDSAESERFDVEDAMLIQNKERFDSENNMPIPHKEIVDGEDKELHFADEDEDVAKNYHQSDGQDREVALTEISPQIEHGTYQASSVDDRQTFEISGSEIRFSSNDLADVHSFEITDQNNSNTTKETSQSTSILRTNQEQTAILLQGELDSTVIESSRLLQTEQTRVEMNEKNSEEPRDAQNTRTEQGDVSTADYDTAIVNANLTADRSLRINDSLLSSALGDGYHTKQTTFNDGTDAENQSLEEEAGSQSPLWNEKVMTTAKNIYGSLGRRMKRKKKQKKDTGDVSGEHLEGDIVEEDDESYESGSDSDEDMEEHSDEDDNVVKTGDKDLDLNKIPDNMNSPLSDDEMRSKDESPQTNSATDTDISQLSSEYKQREVKGIAAEEMVQPQGSSVLHSDMSSSLMFAKGIEAPEVNMDPTATFHQESDITGDWTEDQSTNTLSLMETDLSGQKTEKLVSEGSLDQDALTFSTHNVDEKEHSVSGEGINVVDISNQSNLISELIRDSAESERFDGEDVMLIQDKERFDGEDKELHFADEDEDVAKNYHQSDGQDREVALTEISPQIEHGTYQASSVDDRQTFEISGSEIRFSSNDLADVHSFEITDQNNSNTTKETSQSTSILRTNQEQTAILLQGELDSTVIESSRLLQTEQTRVEMNEKDSEEPRYAQNTRTEQGDVSTADYDTAIVNANLTADRSLRINDSLLSSAPGDSDPLKQTTFNDGTDAENQSLEEEAGSQSPLWNEKVMTTAKNIYGSLGRRMKRKKKQKKDTGDVSGEHLEGDIVEEDDESYESGSDSDEDMEEHSDEDDNVVKTGDKDLDLNKIPDNMNSPLSDDEMRSKDESPQTNSATDISQLSSEYKQREVKGIAAEEMVQPQGSSVLHSDMSSSLMFAKGIEAPEVNMDPTATFHQESDITGDWTEDQSTNTLSLMETDLSGQKTEKLVSEGSLDQDALTFSTHNVDEKEQSVSGEGINVVDISNQSNLISELIRDSAESERFDGEDVMLIQDKERFDGEDKELHFADEDEDVAKNYHQSDGQDRDVALTEISPQIEHGTYQVSSVDDRQTFEISGSEIRFSSNDLADVHSFEITDQNNSNTTKETSQSTSILRTNQEQTAILLQGELDSTVIESSRLLQTEQTRVEMNEKDSEEPRNAQNTRIEQGDVSTADYDTATMNANLTADRSLRINDSLLSSAPGDGDHTKQTTFNDGTDTENQSLEEEAGTQSPSWKEQVMTTAKNIYGSLGRRMKRKKKQKKDTGDVSGEHLEGDIVEEDDESYESGSDSDEDMEQHCVEDHNVVKTGDKDLDLNKIPDNMNSPLSDSEMKSEDQSPQTNSVTDISQLSSEYKQREVKGMAAEEMVQPQGSSVLLSDMSSSLMFSNGIEASEVSMDPTATFHEESDITGDWTEDQSTNTLSLVETDLYDQKSEKFVSEGSFDQAAFTSSTQIVDEEEHSVSGEGMNVTVISSQSDLRSELTMYSAESERFDVEDGVHIQDKEKFDSEDDMHIPDKERFAGEDDIRIPNKEIFDGEDNELHLADEDEDVAKNYHQSDRQDREVVLTEISPQIEHGTYQVSSIDDRKRTFEMTGPEIVISRQSFAGVQSDQITDQNNTHTTKETSQSMSILCTSQEQNVNVLQDEEESTIIESSRLLQSEQAHVTMNEKDSEVPSAQNTSTEHGDVSTADNDIAIVNADLTADMSVDDPLLSSAPGDGDHTEQTTFNDGAETENQSLEEEDGRQSPSWKEQVMMTAKNIYGSLGRRMKRKKKQKKDTRDVSGEHLEGDIEEDDDESYESGSDSDEDMEQHSDEDDNVVKTSDENLDFNKISDNMYSPLSDDEMRLKDESPQTNSVTELPQLSSEYKQREVKGIAAEEMVQPQGSNVLHSDMSSSLMFAKGIEAPEVNMDPTATYHEESEITGDWIEDERTNTFSLMELHLSDQKTKKFVREGSLDQDTLASSTQNCDQMEHSVSDEGMKVVDICSQSDITYELTLNSSESETFDVKYDMLIQDKERCDGEDSELHLADEDEEVAKNYYQSDRRDREVVLTETYPQIELDDYQASSMGDRQTFEISGSEIRLSSHDLADVHSDQITDQNNSNTTKETSQSTSLLRTSQEQTAILLQGEQDSTVIESSRLLQTEQTRVEMNEKDSEEPRNAQNTRTEQGDVSTADYDTAIMNANLTADRSLSVNGSLLSSAPGDGDYTEQTTFNDGAETENQSLEEEDGRQSPSWKEKVMTTAKNIYGSLGRRMKRKKKQKKDTGDVSGEHLEGDIEEDDESYESGSDSDEDLEQHCVEDDNVVKTGDEDLDLNKISDNIYSPLPDDEMRSKDESPQTNSATDISQLSSEYKQREVKGIAAEVTVQPQGSSVLHSDMSSSLMFAKGIEAPELAMASAKSERIDDENDMLVQDKGKLDGEDNELHSADEDEDMANNYHQSSQQDREVVMAKISPQIELGDFLASSVDDSQRTFGISGSEVRLSSHDLAGVQSCQMTEGEMLFQQEVVLSTSNPMSSDNEEKILGFVNEQTLHGELIAAQVASGQENATSYLVCADNEEKISGVVNEQSLHRELFDSRVSSAQEQSTSIQVSSENEKNVSSFINEDSLHREFVEAQIASGQEKAALGEVENVDKQNEEDALYGAEQSTLSMSYEDGQLLAKGKPDVTLDSLHHYSRETWHHYADVQDTVQEVDRSNSADINQSDSADADQSDSADVEQHEQTTDDLVSGNSHQYSSKYLEGEVTDERVSYLSEEPADDNHHYFSSEDGQRHAVTNSSLTTTISYLSRYPAEVQEEYSSESVTVSSHQQAPISRSSEDHQASLPEDDNDTTEAQGTPYSADHRAVEENNNHLSQQQQIFNSSEDGQRFMLGSADSIFDAENHSSEHSPGERCVEAGVGLVRQQESSGSGQLSSEHGQQTLKTDEVATLDASDHRSHEFSHQYSAEVIRRHQISSETSHQTAEDTQGDYDPQETSHQYSVEAIQSDYESHQFSVEAIQRGYESPETSHQTAEAIHGDYDSHGTLQQHSAKPIEGGVNSEHGDDTPIAQKSRSEHWQRSLMAENSDVIIHGSRLDSEILKESTDFDGIVSLPPEKSVRHSQQSNREETFTDLDADLQVEAEIKDSSDTRISSLEESDSVNVCGQRPVSDLLTSGDSDTRSLTRESDTVCENESFSIEDGHRYLEGNGNLMTDSRGHKSSDVEGEGGITVFIEPSGELLHHYGSTEDERYSIPSDGNSTVRAGGIYSSEARQGEAESVSLQLDKQQGLSSERDASTSEHRQAFLSGPADLTLQTSGTADSYPTSGNSSLASAAALTLPSPPALQQLSSAEDSRRTLRKDQEIVLQVAEAEAAFQARGITLTYIGNHAAPPKAPRQHSADGTWDTLDQDDKPLIGGDTAGEEVNEENQGDQENLDPSKMPLSNLFKTTKAKKNKSKKNKGKEDKENDVTAKGEAESQLATAAPAANDVTANDVAMTSQTAGVTNKTPAAHDDAQEKGIVDVTKAENINSSEAKTEVTEGGDTPAVLNTTESREATMTMGEGPQLALKEGAGVVGTQPNKADGTLPPETGREKESLLRDPNPDGMICCTIL